MREKKKIENAYKEAGVDIDAATAAVNSFKAGVAGTYTEGVLSRVGNFGGMFSLAGEKMKEPVLVCSTDGVGTKLLVAQLAGRHDSVGRCLVNHCVNDIMVQGAKPLFFMDYISVGRLRPEHINQVMAGFIAGCRENQIALLGGETAEMPDLYAGNDYDLAGFIVGVVDRDRIITGEKVRAGNLIVGFPSSGLHTNGYSLARKIVFSRLGLKLGDPLPESGVTLGDALLAVHKSYRQVLEKLFARDLVLAAAHITGGGLTDNLPRVFPASLDAEIQTGSWPVPPIFEFLVGRGNLGQEEAYRVFNMGIGMALITGEEKLDEVAAVAGSQGEDAVIIGRMVPGSGRVLYT